VAQCATGSGKFRWRRLLGRACLHHDQRAGRIDRREAQGGARGRPARPDRRRAESKPDSFYADELQERLRKGPAAFDLLAILAEAGDATTDVTATWPEESRKSVKLGTIAIAALEPDATCDAATFDPVVDLPEGLAGPKDDPMFEIRSPAYALHAGRS
jgi:hypothetical protein